MYAKHSIFKKPDNEDIKIWRYLDFTKFVSLLDKEALFFVKVDKLKDKFEGIYPKNNLKLQADIMQNNPNSNIPYRQIFDFIKNQRKNVVVNSWHMNEYESVAMWKLYLKSDEGVAIQSTYKRLEGSFNKLINEVYISEVKYINYEVGTIPQQHNLYPYIYKSLFK